MLCWLTITRLLYIQQPFIMLINNLVFISLTKPISDLHHYYFPTEFWVCECQKIESTKMNFSLSHLNRFISANYVIK